MTLGRWIKGHILHRTRSLSAIDICWGWTRWRRSPILDWIDFRPVLRRLIYRRRYMLSVVIGCSISGMHLCHSSRTLTWWWSRVIVHLIFVTIRVPVLLLWIVTTILRSWHELGSLPSREKELQHISILISYQMA